MNFSRKTPYYRFPFTPILNILILTGQDSRQAQPVWSMSI